MRAERRFGRRGSPGSGKEPLDYPPRQAPEQIERPRRVQAGLGQLERPQIPGNWRFFLAHLKRNFRIALLKNQFGIGIVERDLRGEALAVELPGGCFAAEQIGNIADVQIKVGAVFRLLQRSVEQPRTTIERKRAFQAAPFAMHRLGNFGKIPPGLGRIFR